MPLHEKAQHTLLQGPSKTLTAGMAWQQHGEEAARCLKNISCLLCV